MKQKKLVGGLIVVVLLILSLFLFLPGSLLPDGNDGEGENLGEGTVTFERFPVDYTLMNNLSEGLEGDGWWPLGHLNPPGHTFPTSHSYIFFPSCNTTVRAPADGKVTWIYGDRSDCEVYLNHTSTFTSLIGHVNLTNGGVSEGDVLEAGDPIGRAIETQRPGLDWGVINLEHTNNFMSPSVYSPSSEMLHGVPPFAYFNDSMQDTLDDYIARTDEPIGGKFDYDQSGKLVGNWFVEGNMGIGVDNCHKHLAFVYDMANDSDLRVSVGGTLDCNVTAWKVDSGPDPATVTSDDGPTTYHLTDTSPEGSFSATMLVEVLPGEERIKVETWNSIIEDPAFSDPTYYER